MTRATVGILALLLLMGCSDGGTRDASKADHTGVMEVIARGLTFEAPAEIAAGWTTIRFRNESTMTHFAMVERMPEGKGIAAQQEEVAPVFQEGMDLLNEGRSEEAMAAFGRLPDWFGKIVFLGGPGLTSAGHTSEATVLLEPGTYLLECYVKTNGVFHSYNASPDVYGMVHEFRVTDEPSGAPEPKATLRISISAEHGIESAGPVPSGRQTIAVRFLDQTTHENFVGHDVHLLRVADDTDLDALEAWMDWSAPGGLQTPAPAEFLGGLNEMPAGSTGYFTVDLEPGKYAWISEVPDASAKGMLKEFEVAERASE
jgi:hypothetical protein